MAPRIYTDSRIIVRRNSCLHIAWQVDFEDSIPQCTKPILLIISSYNDYRNVQHYTCRHKLSSEECFQKHFKINLKYTN